MVKRRGRTACQLCTGFSGTDQPEFVQQTFGFEPRRSAYGTLMEALYQDKPLLILPLMQMKVRFLLSRFLIGSTLEAEQIRMKRYMSDRR